MRLSCLNAHKHWIISADCDIMSANRYVLQEMIRMYKPDNGQISIMEFISPFGVLNPKNQWVVIANMIPWTYFERKYMSQFCSNNGAPAIKFRMAMGTLLIKQITTCSDDEVIEAILESPYKQYLIGLHEFTTTSPFSQSSITNFRKYITAEMMNDINEYIFRNSNPSVDSAEEEAVISEEGSGEVGVGIEEAIISEENCKEESANKNVADDNEEKTESHMEEQTNNKQPQETGTSPNKGTLILDATCAPSDIAYPTDINLLNEAREKLEMMIDILFAYCPIIMLKPRTYRKVARREYLQLILKKKPKHEEIRAAIEQQLKYVNRDLKNIDNLLKIVPIEVLKSYQQTWLETIRLLYEQQLYMFENNTHTVENRIVSIGQPHVRPIKRGKARNPYEFGAKVSISLVDGYAFIDQLSWNSFNEESQLIPAVEAYFKHYGFYPERVLADQIYRNKANRDYCKALGIRLSGPRLGKSSKGTNSTESKFQAKDSADRNAVEGKFGEGKKKYGLGRVMARIKESCETVISLAFLCLNLKRKLRVLFCLRIFMFFAQIFTNNAMNIHLYPFYGSEINFYGVSQPHLTKQ